MIGPPPSTSVEVTQCDQGMNGRYAPDEAYPVAGIGYDQALLASVAERLARDANDPLEQRRAIPAGRCRSGTRRNHYARGRSHLPDQRRAEVAQHRERRRDQPRSCSLQARRRSRPRFSNPRRIPRHRHLVTISGLSLVERFADPAQIGDPLTAPRAGGNLRAYLLGIAWHKVQKLYADRGRGHLDVEVQSLADLGVGPITALARRAEHTRCRRPLRYSLCRSACLLAPFGEV